MKLIDLEPTFLLILEPNKHYRLISDLASAQGVQFLCPKCFAANGGSVGTHVVICWFRDRGVLDTEDPKPGRWWAHGTDYGDLTLTGSSDSILLLGGCAWHGYLRNGEISNA